MLARARSSGGGNTSTASPAAETAPSYAIPTRLDALNDGDPVLERSARLSEQARRRADLHREVGVVQAAAEREDAYWTQQQERFTRLTERSEIAALTGKELHKSLLRLSKLVGGLSESLEGLEPFGSAETGTLSKACSAHDILRKTNAQYLSELRSKPLAESVKRASELSRTMTYRTEALEEAGRRQLKLIRADRQHVHDAFNNYVSSIDARNERELADKAVQPSRDPYLLTRAYDREVTQLRSSETRYRKEMHTLFTDMRTEEVQRIGAVKNILSSNLAAQRLLLENLIKFTDSTMAAVAAINPEADVQEFVQAAGLVIPTHEACFVSAVDSGQARAADTATTSIQAASVPTNSTAPSPAQSATPAVVSIFEAAVPSRDPHLILRLYKHELDKEGPLYRQGKIIKSSWKLVHAAVSNSGVFHYGDADDVKGPADVSITLAGCSVQRAARRDVAGFEIIQPSNSWLPMSSSATVHFFKASSAQQADDWVSTLKKYATAEPPQQSSSAAAVEARTIATPTHSDASADEDASDQLERSSTEINDVEQPANESTEPVL